MFVFNILYKEQKMNDQREKNQCSEVGSSVNEEVNSENGYSRREFMRKVLHHSLFGVGALALISYSGESAFAWHDDIPHADTPHTDEHTDYSHGDGPWHQDQPHEDHHTVDPTINHPHADHDDHHDYPHGDTAHEDIAHADTAHSDHDDHLDHNDHSDHNDHCDM